MMRLELAPCWKSRNGGMPSTALAQSLAIFPTLRNSGLYQNHKEAFVKEVFKDTDVNVTVEGKKHLGAMSGSREYLEEYASMKVTNWVSEVTKLGEFALSQPQAFYAAYTFGLKR